MKKLLLLFFCFASLSLLAQSKASGEVFDERGEPVPFANVIFEGSTIGTITNENGRFYLESDNTYDTLVISFLGFEPQRYELESRSVYNIVITLEEADNQLNEVIIYQGKTSKKDNPALNILRKIWDNRRENGVKKFAQYQYDKYEKLEFDLNTIDSTLINSRVFNGMEFIFNETDTNNITGKTYLPIFINEASTKVYGDNELNEVKEDLQGNKNSGFSNNQNLIAFIKDLYADYDVYDNYIKFFDKSFTSPLSRTGINVYNYVLNDSAYIGNKWCYNIVYYPRRKNELTFKGDFWVNDTTWAIKDINLRVSKSANINWVKEVYIEQEFDVLNDSTFLITRDYFLSDFSFRKKEGSRGIYGKRTTLYDNYKFNIKKPKDFYDNEVDPFNTDIYNRDESFWANKRLEELNKDEIGVYKMLDTLKTVKAFKRLYDIGSILATGYIDYDGWDYGPIFSTFGFNSVEGVRLRFGGRTYNTLNDLWRFQGYGAYGLKDNQFKYGISGKVLLDRKSRLIVSAGNRRDIEQLGASLTNSTDVLGRSLASSSLITVGSNDRLSSINLSSLAFEIEPKKNFNIRTDFIYKTIKSASPTFNLDYFTDDTQTTVASGLKQFEVSTKLTYSPGKKTSGYGVERTLINDGEFPSVFLNYTVGVPSLFESDFDYQKVQFYYRQPWKIGGFGRMTTTLEAGKTYGEVPLALLSVVPGNQTLFSIFNSFPLLNFYEFVTDSYTSFHLEHNFNGRFFSRIPALRELNLREIVGIRGVYGTISDENRALDASGVFLRAPDSEPYFEYSVGVGNIFRIFRLDFHFRGNYLDVPDARSFGVTGAFGFSF